MGSPRISTCLIAVLAVVMAWSIPVSVCNRRWKAMETLSAPLEDNELRPQQVHVSLVGLDKMRVTWITDGHAPPTVDYGKSPGSNEFSASGSTSSYSYVIYSSGRIHDVVIGPLEPDTVYYYRCSGNYAHEFSLRTPSAQLPVKFAIAGDLGQTERTISTLEHVSSSAYDVLLLPGDLSYADFYHPLWDSFGRLVEPLASARPWMVTQGNHEIERIPFLHDEPFTAYNARWRMPYETSGSGSNLYYSFDVADRAIHVIMLASYADFDSGSSQFKWLESDLAKIDRGVTKWVVAVLHAPWYNSNKDHQSGAEGKRMRKAMEGLLYGARVDVVFAGHVHAYERFTRVYDNKADQCGAVHITVGGGGNREGLSTHFMNPQPTTSLFREAEFGHVQFEVANETHARLSWHRNDDDEFVVGDQVWLTSLGSNPNCSRNICGETIHSHNQIS